MIVFDRTVPEGERVWIARLVTRFLRACGMDAGKWELVVRCKRFRGTQLAQCDAEPMSTRAVIILHPGRLVNREAVKADLMHELWHLLDEELRDTLADLAAHIPDEKKRRRAFRRAERRYEGWHDRTARIVGGLIG